MKNTPQRLNRILSTAGLTSRREADRWISAGRITLNDRPVTRPGTRAVWGVDRIKLNGKEIPGPPDRLYLMLNKPFGYISTLRDPQGRPLVTDLLRDVHGRVYPVGRLDFDTMGLLLFTNDGELAHHLTHPRYKVPRTYKVTVKGELADRALKALRRGVTLKGGPLCRARVILIRRSQKQSELRMIITQGRTRQVRRMLDAVGYNVVHLIRTGFGRLNLGDLKVGDYRHLEKEEVLSLKKLVGLA